MFAPGHPLTHSFTEPVIMRIVIADDLPASAADLLRAEPGWTVDARAGRPAPELVAALVDADALVVRSATKVTAAIIQL